jgi:hypothetical protein
MKILTLLILILQTTAIFACEGFLPPNDLYISPLDKNEGLSELQYNEVINKVEKVYAPVARQYGATLKIDRKWSSGTVNAGTFRDERDTHWHVNLYGGLARHQFMTEDGYALVICHEIGHHIGGAPKKIINEKPFWASTEGQADYWATLKCLRRIFKDENNESYVQDLTIPPIVTQECEKSFNSKKAYSLCVRLAMAGKALSRISAGIRATAPPEFETPDSSIVAQIYDKHPAPQCRLDSYFQGTLCPRIFSEPVSQLNELEGTCHLQNNYPTGRRPHCWYRPSDLKYKGLP